MFGFLVLLAAVRLPVVEGRVGEPADPASGAQVTLMQPGRAPQVLRIGPDGVYRFRAFEGPGTVAVTVPPGWTLSGAASQAFEQALAGDFVRLDFPAHARRVLRGRVLYEGEPLQDVALEGLLPGRNTRRVAPLGLLATFAVPQPPGEISRDVDAVAPAVASLGHSRVPQPPAVRPAASWLAGKPLSEPEVAAIERLCAVAALDPAFRLVMTAAPHDAKAAQAALLLHRYLTGPGMVAPERVLFAVGEVAPTGQLALILMR